MDEDNVWVFAGHFGKVLNDMKPTNTSVINVIHLRKAMKELDSPPEWAEFIIAVVDLTNDKSHGLNGVPPNAFKSMTAENLLHILTSSCNYGRIGSTLWSGMRSKLCQCQKVGISPTQINGGY